MTNTISKSKLRAKMFEIFHQIETSGEELIVTDHSIPVLKLVPIKSQQTAEDLFGPIQGRVRYHEDINTTTISEWNDTYSEDSR